MPEPHIEVMPRLIGARPRTWILFLFIFLLAWQVVLVWIFPHFVTQDGGSHLYNATLLRSFHDPAWNRLHEFYRRNPRLVPNWSTYAALLGLERWLSPAAAEKVLVTAYFFLFPLAFVYVLRGLSNDVGSFAIWGLVFANNLFIAMGFYNFCYSLILFLLSFGYWMRWRNRFRVRQLVTLCAMVSLLYFTHAFGFFMAALFMGVASLSCALEEWRSRSKDRSKDEDRRRDLFSLLVKRVAAPLFAFVPGIVIFLVFSVGSQPPLPGGRNFWQRLLVFRDLHVLVDSRGIWGALGMCLIGGFLLWGWYVSISTPRRRSVDGLGLLAILCFGLCAVAPWSIAGGGPIPERMAWFALCAAFLWLGSRSGEWTDGARHAAVSVSVFVVVLGLIHQTEWRYRMSPLLDAYDEAGRLLAPQKTILLLCYCNPADNANPIFSQLRFRPLEHAGDIAALEGRALSLGNYEAMGSAFPVEYEARINPYLHAKSFSAVAVSSEPQNADIADYEASTGKTVDYVLLWGKSAGASSQRDSTLGRQLEANYKLIYVSKSPAELRLFQRTKK